MEIMGAVIIMALCVAGLYLHRLGRATVWGLIAARAKANYEAALLRERRTRELREEWGVVESGGAA